MSNLPNKENNFKPICGNCYSGYVKMLQFINHLDFLFFELLFISFTHSVQGLFAFSYRCTGVIYILGIKRLMIIGLLIIIPSV